jgi:extracellular elastinolytic metalloproteinase
LGDNPSTYGFLKRADYWEVHAKGEVWAEILYQVYVLLGVIPDG